MTARLGDEADLAAVDDAWRGRSIIGCFFLVTGGVHLGIVAADTDFYRPFADEALFGFVRSGWRDVFMSAPAAWGLAVCAGELAIGMLLLTHGPTAQLGWCGAIAFHVLLMLFGFGFWLWCVPALLLLVSLAIRDWPRLSSHHPGHDAALPRPRHA
jgi:hypothetical protein